MTSNIGKPVVVPNSTVEINIIGKPTVKVAATRLNFSLSWIAAMITSITEMKEVNAAKVNEPKNNTPNTEPNGASLIMVGKAMKANPIPPFATSLTS